MAKICGHVTEFPINTLVNWFFKVSIFQSNFFLSKWGNMFFLVNLTPKIHSFSSIRTQPGPFLSGPANTRNLFSFSQSAFSYQYPKSHKKESILIIILKPFEYLYGWLRWWQRKRTLMWCLRKSYSFEKIIRFWWCLFAFRLKWEEEVGV